MELNIVVKKLIEVVGTDKIEYISGIINSVGSKECALSDTRGSVYGIAIKLENESDKTAAFLVAAGHRKIQNINEWEPIKDNWYPLYWGKDKNMGARLTSHCHALTSTATLQLCNIALKGEIIYGALPCVNYDTHEKTLISRFKPLLCTDKGKGADDADKKCLTEILCD
ncbi:MAG: hypothetical protein ACI4MZ_01935 [Christensenellales bacterium]